MTIEVNVVMAAASGVAAVAVGVEVRHLWWGPADWSASTGPTAHLPPVRRCALLVAPRVAAFAVGHQPQRAGTDRSVQEVCRVISREPRAEALADAVYAVAELLVRARWGAVR